MANDSSPNSRRPTAAPATVPAAQPTGDPDPTSCPDCSNATVSHDPSRGEYTCSDCGLVLSENEIDHGPEWRHFPEDGNPDPSRVGSSRNPTMHDYGLSTVIGYKDGSGNHLRSEKPPFRHTLFWIA